MFIRVLRLEWRLDGECQVSANTFNTNALKNLKNLAAIAGPAAAPLAISGANIKGSTAKPAKLQVPDSCICLFAASIRQPLFIAPCSYTFHYKCIKPLIEAHHPAFSCPLCQTYADLVEIEATDLGADPDADADIEIDDGPSRAANNNAANQSDNAGAATAPTPPRPFDAAQHRHGEDAEMSNGRL